MASEKPKSKASGLPAHLVPGNPGNSGGKKGRSGRKPDWLKRWCDKQLADPKCTKAVRTILSNPDHQAFAQMWRSVADRAYGKPAQPLEHSVDDSLAALIAGAFNRPRSE